MIKQSSSKTVLLANQKHKDSSTSKQSLLKNESNEHLFNSDISSAHKLSVHKSVHKQNKNTTSKPFINFGHDNWNLVLHMIFGVSKSVRAAITEEAFNVRDDDFSRKYHYELHQQKEMHSSQNLNPTSQFQFFDFAPRVFHAIRCMYHITPTDYLKSIGPENLLGSLIGGNITSLKEQFSTGKSGSFFYYTADSRYMLKTIHHDEFDRLKQILKIYYEHLVKYP